MNVMVDRDGTLVLVYPDGSKEAFRDYLPEPAIVIWLEVQPQERRST